MKTALVTGGAGFLGFHLSHKLLENGYSVLSLDNYITGTEENTRFLKEKYPESFSFYKQDVTQDWAALVEHPWTSSIELVFHFASIASPELFPNHSLEILTANSVGLQRAIEFADVNKARVIFASTSEVYGSSLHTPFKESDWGLVNSYGPRSCYDEAKRFGEAVIYAMNQRNKTQHGLVRIFNTYGPRMNSKDQRAIPYFIKQALMNEPIEIFGDGKQTRSFCYVDDLIDGVFKYALTSLTAPINLGNDHEITISETANCVKKILKSDSPIEFLPAREDDPIRRQPDLQRAMKLLYPWKPQISLTDGLIKTSEDMKRRLEAK